MSGRITALALDTFNGCTAGFCRLWAAAAGGGIWRTTNALAGTPTWSYISGGPGGFVTNAIGALTFFDNGTPNGLLFAGTGEPNASGDSEAGVGVYKSTDGGNTWTLLPAQIGPITSVSSGTGSNGTYTGNAFLGRSISSVVVDPTNTQILYVSSARGVRGVASTGGATSNPTTPRPPFGLFKSVDGGQTFSFIFDGDPTCGPGTCLGGGAFSTSRGVTQTKLDPNNHNIVYASDFPNLVFGTGGGIWRSTDAGSTWIQILPDLAPDPDSIGRCAFDVTSLGSPVTRMYAGCGNDGFATASFFRSNNAQGAAAFTNLTAAETVRQTAGYCTGQCWYDNFVFTPPGFPNFVYLGGSFDYTDYDGASDGRGLLASNGAGTDLTWYDWTWDAQNNGGVPDGTCCQATTVAPNGIHPDQHAIIFNPTGGIVNAVQQFFEGSDGGVVRSDANPVSITGQCPGRVVAGTITTGAQFAECVQLLTFVPNQIFSLNVGLDTLQFQSVRVAANNVNNIQGGTQDNGTWGDLNGSVLWNQLIFGDGGQGGFATGNSNLRFNTYTGKQNSVSFQNGNPVTWDFISSPLFGVGEVSQFYPPVISDPVLGATIFQGSSHVWRTQDWGGPQVFLDATCNVFGATPPTCGDFVPLGGPAGPNQPGALNGSFYNPGRAGGSASVISRTFVTTTTAWAATSTGRIFISDNVNGPAAAVVWNRVDNNGANGDPGRFPTEIAIDPFNPHHAWISYSGYNFNTPSQKGHVFSVTWSGAGTATWTDMSFNIWDIPITSVAFDFVTGDLYASSDFVVFRLAASNNPAQQWFVAGLNMPMVETSGLTLIPGSRVLYAATHGLGIWKLNLP